MLLMMDVHSYRRGGTPGSWDTEPIGSDEPGIASNGKEMRFDYALSFIHLYAFPWILTAGFVDDEGIVLVGRVTT